MVATRTTYPNGTEASSSRVGSARGAQETGYLAQTGWTSDLSPKANTTGSSRNVNDGIGAEIAGNFSHGIDSAIRTNEDYTITTPVPPPPTTVTESFQRAPERKNRQRPDRVRDFDLRRPIILLSKRLLPNAVRLRAIIALQRAMNWVRYSDANFPRTIAIEISVFCNRTCHYCPNSTNKTPKLFMSDQMFDLALRRLADIGWRGIVDYNFYNEPTADPRLIDFIKRTRETVPGAIPRIVTNGDYLTRDQVNDLIGAGVVNFSISRHYPVNEAWDRKIAGLVQEYPDHVTLHRIWPRTDLSNRGGEVQIASYQPISKCDAPAVALNILRNGDVILCCCDYKRRHVFGNIQQSGLLDIWRNPEFVDQRRNVRNGNPQYDICKACFGKSR